MARPKKDQTEEIPQERTSKDLLHTILQDNEEDHFCYVESKNKVISTGSLLLDSLVKVRSGSVIRLCGKSAELGKSSQAFVFATNYMEVMPKSKTLLVKAEARLSPEMQARSGHKFVFKPEDWNEGTTFVFSCAVFEVVAKTIETLLPSMHQSGEHLCIIIDSLDGLSLKNDLSKDIFGEKPENVKVAGVPLLTKLLFKRLGLSLNAYDALLIVTSQHTAEIKLDPYAPATVRQTEASGGNSIAHQSDYVFQYLPRYQSDYILEFPSEKPDFQKNKTLGVYATIEIKKSGTDVTGTKIKIPIKKGRIGCAIWTEFEICDLLLGWEMVKKGGAGWFTFTPELITELKPIDENVPEKIQGMNNIRIYLESQPKVTKYLFDKFISLIG